MAKILIVDDSWLTRRSLGNIMGGSGYEVLEAENGQEGIERILSAEPDCVILDLLMPGMTGFEVLQDLKDKGVSTPVIIVTADIQDTVRKKCLNLGAYDFINKPPVEVELLDTVRTAIGKIA